MARYNGPVCRLCRREGAKLYLKGDRCYTNKCAIDRRGYAPGEHGQSRKKFLSTVFSSGKNRRPAGFTVFWRPNSATTLKKPNVKRGYR